MSTALAERHIKTEKEKGKISRLRSQSKNRTTEFDNYVFLLSCACIQFYMRHCFFFVFYCNHLLSDFFLPLTRSDLFLRYLCACARHYTDVINEKRDNRHHDRTTTCPQEKSPSTHLGRTGQKCRWSLSCQTLKKNSKFHHALTCVFLSCWFFRSKIKNV